MKYKEKLLNEIDEVSSIINDIEILESNKEKLSNLKNEINDFGIFVPLVGGFNAGKSSLINKYLDNDILPIDIVPETALAAEIKYSDEEKVIAHNNSGSIEEFSIEEIENIESKKYKYLEVYQKNNKIERLQNKDITLVDMPGLDSGIEDHNKAIFNYIKDGVYYIVLTDIDHGLKGSVINFLKELNIYDMEFSVLLTKTDIKPPTDISNMYDATEKNLKNLFGQNKFLGKISSVTDNINDFENILNNINKSKIYKQNFNHKLITALDIIIKELNLKLEYFDVDTEVIDAKIEEINTKIEEIESSLDRESEKIENEFTNNTKRMIISDVRNILLTNINRLVESAKNNTQDFQRTVNEIIRPVLVKSTNDNIFLVLEQSFDNINANMESVFSSISGTENELPNISKKLETLKDKTDVGRLKDIISVLAIITDKIAPWLEVILMFLPDIIKLFSNQEKKIRNKIENEVIPQITDKLETELYESLETTKSQFITNMRKEINQEKNDLNKTLQKIKEDKKIKIENVKKEKEYYKENIDKLREIKFEFASL